jgi:protein tyrosine phosphatase
MESEFEEYESQPNGWVHLYHQLRAKSKSEMGSITVARLPINQGRNRYRDVLALDETRVLLDDSDNNYINANYVKVEDVEKNYILSQGPLRSTCPHFWQMVWEQNCKGIVMLNRIIEKGMLKCEPYWPATESRSPMEYGDFVISLLSREEKFAFTICQLELKNTNSDERRNITHFQYTDWPDFGIPETPDVFLTFLQEVRDSGVLSPEEGPCIVHCSAGIGRSGTFSLVDVILARVEKTRETDSIDIQSTLFDMRKQRYGLIQSPDQLKFSYMAIIEGSSSILSQENGNIVSAKPQESKESEDEELPPPLHGKLNHAQPSLDEGDQSAAKRVRFGQLQDGEDEDDEDSVSDKVSSTNSVESDPEEDLSPPPIPPRPPSLDSDLNQLERKGLLSAESSGKPFNIYGDFDNDAQSGAVNQQTNLPQQVCYKEPTDVKDVFLGRSSPVHNRDNDLRRRERKEQMSERVQSMRERGFLHEERKAMGNWSPAWILATFAAVVFFFGYSGYRWYYSR